MPSHGVAEAGRHDLADALDHRVAQLPMRVAKLAEILTLDDYQLGRLGGPRRGGVDVGFHDCAPAQHFARPEFVDLDLTTVGAPYLDDRLALEEEVELLGRRALR